MLTRFRFYVATGGFGYGRLIFYSLTLVIATALIWGCAHKKYRAQEIQCLAMNIYHEARGEPVLGRQAVAIVTMNRVASSRFPDNVCHVVYQRNLRSEQFFGEFSWTQDVYTDIPRESDAWLEALEIARNTYDGLIELEQVDGAIYYHASFITPYWAAEKKRLARIGNHIFYR